MNAKIEAVNFTEEEVEANYSSYLKRMANYKKHGLNQTLLRESIVRRIDNDSTTILEIGTGKGYLTSMLGHKYGRIVSVDNSAIDLRIAALNAAHSRCLDKIEFVTADAGSLGYPDRNFDTVVSAFTFHHLDLPFKVIREMARLARGQVIISDFTDRGFHVVDQVHRQEGNSHERKAVDFDIVGIYLKEFDFDVRVIEDEWQIIYSARRRQ
ncbi:MAG TPA: class I SAM-dependent methyltransferase [Spirochaetota bacterium]|nr:class I SAM-dependent methyltransferase [Spirochaetota bacterium]